MYSDIEPPSTIYVTLFPLTIDVEPPSNDSYQDPNPEKLLDNIFDSELRIVARVLILHLVFWKLS